MINKILKFKGFLYTNSKNKYCLSFCDVNNKQFSLNLQIDNTTLNKIKICKLNKEYNVSFHDHNKNIVDLNEILGVT